MAFNHLPTSQQDADTEELIDRLVSVGAWRVANLTGCYRALDEQGLLQIPAGQPRNLTDAERLRVLALSSSATQIKPFPSICVMRWMVKNPR